jgi:hypothetical protein
MRGIGKFGRAFCDRWGEKTVSSAARKALETLIPSSAGASIPVDMVSAAKYVGIEQILEMEAMTCEGLLSSSPSGTYVAMLRKGQSHVRKRFTLAHEVGHVVIYRSVGAPPLSEENTQIQCQSHTVQHREEEALCDLLAAELLMPHGKFIAAMEEVGVSASTVASIARRFDVSIHAAARRVTQLLPYDVGIGLWGTSQDRAFVSPSWYVSKKGAVSTEHAIPFGAAGSECFTEHAIRGWRWLPLQGQMEKYYVDICPVGDSRRWLVLVIFGTAAQHIISTISKGQPPQEDGQYILLAEPD